MGNRGIIEAYVMAGENASQPLRAVTLTANLSSQRICGRTGHAPCTAVSMGDEQKLGEIRAQLAETLIELRTISQRLHAFDHTVAAVSLRAELSRLRRYLDMLSDTVTIVVQHLLPVAKSGPPLALTLEQEYGEEIDLEARAPEDSHQFAVRQTDQ
jgi:hypothetical protein